MWVWGWGCWRFRWKSVKLTHYHTAHCILQIAHCKLHTAHCTLEKSAMSDSLTATLACQSCLSLNWRIHGRPLFCSSNTMLSTWFYPVMQIFCPHPLPLSSEKHYSVFTSRSTPTWHCPNGRVASFHGYLRRGPQLCTIWPIPMLLPAAIGHSICHIFFLPPNHSITCLTIPSPLNSCQGVRQNH